MTTFVLFIMLCFLIASPSLPNVEADAVRIPFGDGVLTLQAAIYRPSAGTSFPLAVVSHGNPRDDAARKTMQPAYDALRSWFVDHGYAVIVPMRRGFGTSDGDYAEGYGSCDDPHYATAARTTSKDIEAAMHYMSGQPYVDSSRIVLVGHSGGGIGSLAEAAKHPKGVVAVINFAGGRGSQKPDVVCSPDKLVATMATFGKDVRIPTLWVYSQNDHYFGPALAKAMFAAFVAGSPQAEFFAAPPYDGDGHYLADHAGTGWEAPVDAFLTKVVPKP